MYIFSADTLPEKPRLLVCNTDASDKPGQHWICMHFEDGHGEYFDSFGRRPPVNFERYLNRQCSSWTFNRRQLQSVISKFCGHYCIYYWSDLCSLVDVINKTYPSLGSAQPCYYDDDHMNQLGWLNCTECHPFLVHLSQLPANTIA